MTAAGGKPAATRPTNTTDEMLPILGGILALIALAGIVFALVRRRRDAEAWHGDWVDEPEAEHEAVVAPAAVGAHHHDIVNEEEEAVVAPSAFSWGANAPDPSRAEREDGDDRLPGETWVQRAYRGPSANNPSVSLKARLRRAAFFDKRERDVAAGLAEPVDPDAGLPDAMTEERELA